MARMREADEKNNERLQPGHTKPIGWKAAEGLGMGPGPGQRGFSSLAAV